MRGRTPAGGNVTTRASRFPYLIFIFLCVVFFLTGHKWQYSLTVQDEAYREAAVQAVDEGSVIRRTAFMVLGIFGLINIYLTRRTRTHIISNSIVIVILLLLIVISMSILWSDSTSLSVRRLVVFYSMVLASLAVLKRFSIRNFVLLVLGISSVFLVLGLVAELSLGTFEPLTSGYRFAGTVHPNSQGLNCGLMLLAAISAADFKKGRRFYLMIAVIALLFLILTKSRTAFSAALIGAIIYEAMARKTWRRLEVWFVVVMVFLLLALLLGEGFFPQMHSIVSFGRPVGESERELAGRVPLFQECIEYVLKKPVLGYGYGTFWTPDRVEDISVSLGWTTSGAHSIYIDFALELGMTGLFLLLWLVISSFREARRRFRVSSEVSFAFCCGFLLVYVLDGLLESVFLDPGYYSFVSMVVFLLMGFGTGGIQRESRTTGVAPRGSGRTG